MHDDPRDQGPDAPVPPLAPPLMPPVREIDNPARAASPAGRGTKSTVVGALVVGGIAGAVILGPLTTLAASPASPAPSAVTASPSAGTGTAGAPTTGTDSDTDANDNHGGHIEATTDASVVAKAIGISEADLQTALQGGQTVAAVAKAHNVALQVVIDALVADGQAELDAAVKAGTITQAQADAQKAEVVQRATDQANGSFTGGRGDHGGGHTEATTDTSVAAKAIGISEADLLAALATGKTVADVAAAHNVPAQTVIDALVADGQAELAAEVASGAITQTQADAQKAEVTQRATDQVNSTFSGGHH
jgi:transposase-like protein